MPVDSAADLVTHRTTHLAVFGESDGKCLCSGYAEILSRYPTWCNRDPWFESFLHKLAELIRACEGSTLFNNGLVFECLLPKRRPELPNAHKCLAKHGMVLLDGTISSKFSCCFVTHNPTKYRPVQAGEWPNRLACVEFHKERQDLDIREKLANIKASTS